MLHGTSIQRGRRPWDPLARPAGRHLHEAVDVGLLGVDLHAEVGYQPSEFGDHGLGMGQLATQVVGVLGRRQGGFNTTARSR